MRKAGGRLFVDVTPMLASPASRESIVDVMGKGDPLIKDALMTIIERGDFIQSLPDDKQEKTPGKSKQGPSLADFQTLNEYDPAIVSDLIKRSDTSIEELKQNIQTKSGSDLMDFIVDRKAGTLSLLISTNTECAVPGKSILRNLVGAKNQRLLSP